MARSLDLRLPGGYTDNMIILTLHILLGIASVALGAAALLKINAKLLRVQIGAFAGTITTGVGLVIINPASLIHLCVSGTVFSAVSIGLMLATRRQLALAGQIR